MYVCITKHQYIKNHQIANCILGCLPLYLQQLIRKRPTFPSQVQVWLLVAALSLLWGSSFLVLKRVLYVYSPVQVFAGRMLFAGLLLVPLSLRSLRRIPADKWPPLLAIAIIANFATTLLNALAQVSLDSALAGMFSSLTPLMTLFVGGLFFGTLIRRQQALGIILGLVATVVLVFSSHNGQLGAVDFSAFFVIGATICHAFTNHIIRFNLSGLSYLQVAAASFLLIAPLALLAGWQSGLFHLVFFQPEAQRATLYLAFLGIGSNALALLMVARIIQLSSPLTASLVNYGIPIVALGWGLFDGESITWIQVSMASLIIGCIWFLNRKHDDDHAS
jgi:drug/metabolite transporter (DMT)-like permease